MNPLRVFMIRRSGSVRLALAASSTFSSGDLGFRPRFFLPVSCSSWALSLRAASCSLARSLALGLKLGLGAPDQSQTLLGRSDLGQAIAGIITESSILGLVGGANPSEIPNHG